MMHKIEFAIVDSNVLSCMGLQRLLEDIIPTAEIVVFRSFEELVMAETEQFMHYFVASGIYFEHAQYFIARPHRSIVLVHGDSYPHLAGLLTLNVCQDEKSMTKSLLRLQQMGHGMHHAGDITHMEHKSEESVLSQREIEVSIQLAKGMQTKEVADILGISVNTAMVHRRNIMEKLQARSLADIIVYVVRNGLVGLDEL